MEKSAHPAVQPSTGNTGKRVLAWRRGAGIQVAIAAIVLAVALGSPGAAWADNECGPPEAGAPVVCSSATYDAATDGNIVYRPSETHDGDFSIRLSDDVHVRYDRHDPDDDQLIFPGVGVPLYSAVRIETDADHAGDISFFSSADVTSNARGISVGHYGKSGAMRTEISGGSLSIDSDWSRAFAIHSYRGDEFDDDGEFSGDHDVIVRDVDIDLDDAASAGIVGVQTVAGNLNVAVEDSAIHVDAPRATGVWSVHGSAGDVDIAVRDTDIEVRGPGGIDAIYGYHLGTGDTNIVARDVDIAVHGDEYSNGIAFGYWLEDQTGNLTIDAQDVDIEVHGERYLDGIWGIQKGTGDIDVNVRGAAIVTNGADSGGMSFVHDGDGGIDVTAHDVDIEVHGDRSVGIGPDNAMRARGTFPLTFAMRRSRRRERASQASGRSICREKAASTFASTAGRLRRRAPAVPASSSASPAGYSATGRGRSRPPPVGSWRWRGACRAAAGTQPATPRKA